MLKYEKKEIVWFAGEKYYLMDLVDYKGPDDYIALVRKCDTLENFYIVFGKEEELKKKGLIK